MRKLFLFVIISGIVVYAGMLLSGRANFFSGARSNIIMQITSNAFSNNGNIPLIYTCSGNNINPPLTFSGVAKDAKSLALIVDDPDATNGTFTHWIIYNMPPDTKGIGENSPLPGIQVKNSAGLKNYVGPCPPSGVHRYYFKLYALDGMLDTSQVVNRDTLMETMRVRILDSSELMGKFTKGAQ